MNFRETAKVKDFCVSKVNYKFYDSIRFKNGDIYGTKQNDCASVTKPGTCILCRYYLCNADYPDCKTSLVRIMLKPMSSDVKNNKVTKNKKFQFLKFKYHSIKMF